MLHDPFGYIPEEDCTYILWWGAGELCWTNLGGNPIVDTYGTKVNAETILSAIDAILEITPESLGEEPTWGTDGLRRGEMWVLCRVDCGKSLSGQAAAGYSNGEIRQLILSQKAHKVLLSDLKIARKQIAGLGEEICVSVDMPR